MTRRIVACLGALLIGFALHGVPAAEAAPARRDIHFPIEGAVRFRPDFGAPRVGHTHQGNDLMGERLQPLLSAVDGVVTKVRADHGTAGNYLAIEDAAGWEYRYMHLNNDSPGTDDGANPPAWSFAVRLGQRVTAGQHVGWLGDSGNAEGTAPHLHFEIRMPSGAALDPWESLRTARNIPAGTTCNRNTNPPRLPELRGSHGWWSVAADGDVVTSGDAPALGRAPAGAIAVAPAGDGYRTATVDGAVSSFGAPNLGDVAGKRLSAPVVDMAAHPKSDGYWLLGGDGGVFTFGAARFLGSTGAMRLNQPVVGMAATPSGRGYWLVARDGGIFTFGDAVFAGSTGAIRLNEPIVDVAPTRSGRGYWLLARDGGVFAFGDAAWLGSVPGTGACGAVEAVSIGASPSGLGYVIAGSDGRTWSFGDAPRTDVQTRGGIVDFAMLPA